MDASDDVTIRAYDRATDEGGLYDCKLAFERGLGTETGGAEKAAKYEGKLTDDYRADWLDWVDRCTADDDRCVTVAVDDGEVVGYVFCLPASMAFVWDAAVLNELYVAPDYRGAGVADDLMAAALDLARDQDLPLDRIVLDVDRKNERAQAFYDRHGFDHWGELVAREL
ncbi:GNAT family N-acetyltransferase [Halorubrum gandharaense]